MVVPYLERIKNALKSLKLKATNSQLRHSLIWNNNWQFELFLWEKSQLEKKKENIFARYCCGCCCCCDRWKRRSLFGENRKTFYRINKQINGKQIILNSVKLKKSSPHQFIFLWFPLIKNFCFTKYFDLNEIWWTQWKSSKTTANLFNNKNIMRHNLVEIFGLRPLAVRCACLI